MTVSHNESNAVEFVVDYFPTNEIQINGEMFDVISTEKKENFYTVKAVKDNVESTIQHLIIKSIGSNYTWLNFVEIPVNFELFFPTEKGFISDYFEVNFPLTYLQLEIPPPKF